MKVQPGEPVLKQASSPWGTKAATCRAYREAKVVWAVSGLSPSVTGRPC